MESCNRDWKISFYSFRNLLFKINYTLLLIEFILMSSTAIITQVNTAANFPSVFIVFLRYNP